MKVRISKKEAQAVVDNFFRQNELSSEGIRKIKRLAMKHKIKLGVHKKRFCKECYSDLIKGTIRVTETHKTIKCEDCGKKNKWKMI